MIVCVDASLALKVILPEAGSKEAHLLWADWLAAKAELIAPTLWAYEVTSVIRNRAHRGLLAPELEAEAIAAVHNLPLSLLAPQGLHERAWQLARHYDQPAAYDAHYLALSEMAGAQFWTADRALYLAVAEELEWVHHLFGERSG